MSSRPAVSINIPLSQVTEVRERMQELAQQLKKAGASFSNQSQLYRAMAKFGTVVQEGKDLYVKFHVGSVKTQAGD